MDLDDNLFFEFIKLGDYVKIIEKIWVYLIIKQFFEKFVGEMDLIVKEDIKKQVLEFFLKVMIFVYFLLVKRIVENY